MVADNLGSAAGFQVTVWQGPTYAVPRALGGLQAMLLVAAVSSCSVLSRAPSFPALSTWTLWQG